VVSVLGSGVGAGRGGPTVQRSPGRSLSRSAGLLVAIPVARGRVSLDSVSSPRTDPREDPPLVILRESGGELPIGVTGHRV